MKCIIKVDSKLNEVLANRVCKCITAAAGTSHGQFSFIIKKVNPKVECVSILLRQSSC